MDWLAAVILIVGTGFGLGVTSSELLMLELLKLVEELTLIVELLELVVNELDALDELKLAEGLLELLGRVDLSAEAPPPELHAAKVVVNNNAANIALGNESDEGNEFFNGTKFRMYLANVLLMARVP